MCATYKNGSELEMCLEAKELKLSEEPVLPENTTNHQQKTWELHAAAVVQNEETLRPNMRLLYSAM